MVSPTLHAKLSASSAHRWLFCPPVINLELEQGETNRTSDYAAEGTEAHELSEIKLAYQTGKITQRSYNAKLKAFKAKAVFYNQEMEEATESYVELVVERFNEYQSADIELEKRVDFSQWVPDGFGTSDVVILADNVIEIIDLKYGKGIQVSAHQNPQMGLYALGAYAAYDMIYDFEKVRMTIVQPRLGSVSTVELFTEELLYWADNIVRPAAFQAMEGIGDWDMGGKVLQWSSVAARLVPRAAKHFEFIERFDMEDPTLLSIEELSEILTQAEDIKKWIKDIEGYAFAKALKGETVPGFKLVEGRSNRTISNKEEAAKLLEDEGYSDIYKPQELIALGALEKEVGKEHLANIIGDYIIKPAGKLALVPNSDKRPAKNSIEQAAEEFGEYTENGDDLL